MLHLVAFSPDREDLRRQLLKLLQAGDSLLLLEDGCLFAASAHHSAALRDALPPGCVLEVLGTDLQARGLSAAGNAIPETDYEGLVRASEAHQSSMAWWP